MISHRPAGTVELNCITGLQRITSTAAGRLTYCLVGKIEDLLRLRRLLRVPLARSISERRAVQTAQSDAMDAATYGMLAGAVGGVLPYMYPPGALMRLKADCTSPRTRKMSPYSWLLS